MTLESKPGKASWTITFFKFRYSWFYISGILLELYVYRCVSICHSTVFTSATWSKEQFPKQYSPILHSNNTVITFTVEFIRQRPPRYWMMQETGIPHFNNSQKEITSVLFTYHKQNQF